MGILGLALFLAAWLFLPALSAIRAHDLPGLFGILSLTTAMFTETWLDRSLGCMMLGLFYSLFSSWQNPKISTLNHCPPNIS
jgi:hypothetical protein